MKVPFKKIKTKIFKNKTPLLQPQDKGRFEHLGALTIKSAETLLSTHENHVENIYQTLSISRDKYTELYMPLFTNMAFIVQDLPASENHHHSHRGGMLQHSLEVALLAARMRQGIMVTGISEDRMVHVSEALSYAVITAALLHDIGKVYTDMQIANLTLNKIHHPLLDKMKIGQQYAFQFSAERSYTDHLQANLMFAPLLMPSNGMRWLNQYDHVMRHWYRALAGEYADAGDIGQVVARADSTSTQRASIAGNINPTQQAVTNPTKMTPAEIFIRLLRSILTSQPQTLPLNKRGAAGWVSTEHFYFVSKRVIDVIRQEAVDSRSGLNLPDNNSVIMSALGDAGKVTLNEGKAIHLLNIKEGEWGQTMTFLAFPKHTLDPSGLIDIFRGKITNADTGELLHDGDPITDEPPTQDEKAQQLSKGLLEGKGKLTTTNHGIKVKTHDDKATPDYINDKQCHKLSHSDNKYYSSPNALSQSENTATTEKSSNNNLVTEPFNMYDKELIGKHFYTWLTDFITLNYDQINRPGAFYHIYKPNRLMLVTPAVFSEYLKENANLYEQLISDNKDTGRKEVIKKIQFSAERYLNFHRSFSGSHILQFSLTGERKRGILYGYLLTKQSTKSIFSLLDIPNNNIHLKLLIPLD